MESRKLRVVVADDHDLMLAVVSDHLNKYFDVVQSVRRGDKLVQIAVDLQPDVIVSDVSLPRISGIGAMLRLHSMGYTIPFVLMGVDARDITNLFSSGAAAYVHKYDIHADLVEAVMAAHAGNRFISRSVPPGARPSTQLDEKSKR